MTLRLMLKNLKNFITGSPLAFIVVVLLELFGIVAIVLSYGIVRNVFSEREHETSLSRRYMVYRSETRQKRWEDSAAFVKGVQTVIREFGAELDDAFGAGSFTENGRKYICGFSYYPNSDSFYEQKGNTGVDYSDYLAGKKLAHINSQTFPSLSVGDKLTVGGSEYTIYKVSSSDDMWSDIGFYATSMPDNIKASELHLDFTDIPLHDRIDELNVRIRELFGNDVFIVEPEIPDLLLQQFSLTSLSICGAIMLIVVFNCITVYMYVFEKRKNWLSVVKLCGCRNLVCSAVFTGEAMLVTCISTAAGTLIAKNLIIPKLEDVFEAFSLVYTTQSYLILAGAYCILSLIILSVTVKRFVSGTVDSMRKEAA